MIVQNCKFIFPCTAPQKKRVLQMCFFDHLFDKKTVSSTVHTSNKDISTSKRNLLNSILQSEISPFIDKSKLPLLTPLFKSTKHYKINYKFVVNYGVARDIVDKILPNITMTKDIVVEANPGLGFITLCLINSEVPKIIILDKSELLDVSLNQMIQLHKEKLNVINVNLFKYSGVQITDLIGNSIKLNSLTKVIGVISCNTFLINFMYTCVINDLWDTLHYLEFYLVVSSSVWNSIIKFTTKKSKYFYHSWFNFIFKVEELGKYQREAFLPISSNDKGKFTLVKLTANLELIKQISSSNLNSYIFFLQVLSRSKQSFIIPTLEKFVPGCGPLLISKGVSMSNTIRDFCPSESVLLFNIFAKCEGFEAFKNISSASYAAIPSALDILMQIELPD